MATTMPQLPSNPAENRGPELKQLVISMGVLSTTFVLVRLSVRGFISKAVSWDDWLIIASTISSIAAMTCVVKAVENGLGRHMGDVDPVTMVRGLYWVFICQSVFTVTQVLTKLSIGVLMLRIAIQKRYRIAIYATSGFMVVYLLVMLFVFNLNCKDVRSNWDPSIPRQCIPQTTLANITYVIGSCNILTDLMFAIFIPFPMIWQLNTSKRNKASAMFVISLGALACAASIARMPYLVNFGNTIDSLWAMAPVGLWSVVETEVAIIAVCIPSLRPLFRRLLDSSTISSMRKGKSSNTATASHEMYPNTKNFTQISERYTRPDDCESDGTSERGLVQSANAPPGSIQKTTTSIISVQNVPGSPSVQQRTYPWTVQGKY